MTHDEEKALAILREAVKLYAANPAHGEPGYAPDGTGPHCAITALTAAEIRLQATSNRLAQICLQGAAGVGSDDLILWEAQSSTADVVAAFERAAESLITPSA